MSRIGIRRSSLVVGCVALVALVAGIVVFQRGRGDSQKPDPAVELFFGQTLNDAAGQTRAMASLRGKPVVINFWATWCVPCVQEIPAFSQVSREVADRVAFVGLGIDSPDNIRAFEARLKPSYPLLAAGAIGTELARTFGNGSGGLPFTVVLSPDGRVLATHLGRVDDATLRRWIAPFLDAKPAEAGREQH